MRLTQYEYSSGLPRPTVFKVVRSLPRIQSHPLSESRPIGHFATTSQRRSSAGAAVGKYLPAITLRIPDSCCDLVCSPFRLRPARLGAGAPIDRHALVTRHNPTITAIDQSAPFMVGNGNLAFTADITGLQTFPEQYSPLVPLMTQAQWAWHSFPNPQDFTLERAQVPIKVRGKTQKYPVPERLGAGQAGPTSSGCARTRIAFRWARLGLHLATADGKPRRSPICPPRGRRSTCGPAGSPAASCSTALPVEVETSRASAIAISSSCD